MSDDVEALVQAYLAEGLPPPTAREELEQAERALLKLLSNLPKKYRQRAYLALSHVRLAQLLLAGPSAVAAS